MAYSSPLTRQDALAIAEVTALACGTYQEPFEPPEWVLEAIRVAASSGAMLVPPSSDQADTEIQHPLLCTTVDVEI